MPRRITLFIRSARALLKPARPEPGGRLAGARTLAAACLAGGWTLAAACLAFGAALPAGAQTLFIDLNNAATEVAVVQRQMGAAMRTTGMTGTTGAAVAAVAPGLYVVPSYQRITPAARAAVMKAALENERLTTLAQDCAAPEPGRMPRGCATVWDELRRSEVEREAATGHYTFDELQREVEAVLAQVPTFERLIVSGHHEHGYFRGELVSATREQWSRLFARLQQHAAAPHTVVLLGCYTAVPSVMNEVLLPNLARPAQTLIVGAEAPAPTRFEARNLNFLREALAVAPQIHREPQALRVWQQQLRAQRWPVALWLNGRYESQDHAAFAQMPAGATATATATAAHEVEGAAPTEAGGANPADAVAAPKLLSAAR